MTYEEMDHAMTLVKDNLLVQGQLLDRLDRRTAEIAEKIDALRVIAESHEGKIDALRVIAESHEGRIEALVEAARLHKDQLGSMQAAMTALFERMDRFIRGLEANGHKGSGEA